MSFDDYKTLELVEPATIMIDGYYRSRAGINYTHLFFYEKKYFDDVYVDGQLKWMEKNWTMSIWYSLIYIALVFAGKAYMKSRERFNLRGPLIAWNLVLAIFSILGTVRSIPEFYNAIFNRGLEYSVCSKDYAHGVTGCWAWLFIMSKVPELFDTLFIVMRKQQLIFLHWYHHCTVLVYCWYSGHDFSASGRWFITMNYAVHAVMYSYYACRALHIKIPKWVNIAITAGQLSQMIVGIFVNIIGYQTLQSGKPCGITLENIQVSFLMYFSYFLLFFHFFYKTYIAPSGKRTHQHTEKKSSSHHHSNGNGDGIHHKKTTTNSDEPSLKKLD